MGFLQAMIGFLGRGLIAFFFLANGVFTLFNWDPCQESFLSTLNENLGLYSENPLIHQGLEWISLHLFMAFLIMTICQLLGGLMLLLGMLTQLGAMLLLLYFIPFTVLYHRFWFFQGTERQVHMMGFLHCLPIIGILLIFLAYGKSSKITKISAPIFDDK